MAAGNIQYVPEILVIQSRGNSACIVNSPTSLRQEYRGTIPGWIGIFPLNQRLQADGKRKRLPD